MTIIAYHDGALYADSRTTSRKKEFARDIVKIFHLDGNMLSPLGDKLVAFAGAGNSAEIARFPDYMNGYTGEPVCINDVGPALRTICPQLLIRAILLCEKGIGWELRPEMNTVSTDNLITRVKSLRIVRIRDKAPMTIGSGASAFDALQLLVPGLCIASKLRLAVNATATCGGKIHRMDATGKLTEMVSKVTKLDELSLIRELPKFTAVADNVDK